MSHLWALSGAQLRPDATAFIAREHAPAQQLIDVERQRAFDQLSPWSLKGHVWTAPWQELSDVAAALVGCGHVSGLFVRPVWPLAIMLCADRVPIVRTHFNVR